MPSTVPRDATQAGVSLIETLIALFVFAILSVGIVSLVVVVVRTALQSEREIAALALATEQIEIVRSLEYEDVCTVSQGAACQLPEHWGTDPSAATTFTRGDKEYRVGTIISTVAGTQADYKEVEVHIEWDTPGGRTRDARLVTYVANVLGTITSDLSVPCLSSGGHHLTLFNGGSIGGTSFTNNDIIAFDTGSDEWSTCFDASDVGLNAGLLDAFHFLPDGSLLFSLRSNQSLPGISGQLRPEDIVRFIPASWGSSTDGTFELYFDGSDVGLTRDPQENVAAISALPDGRLILSTAGTYNVAGIPQGQDRDLIAFTPSSLGQTTSGSWQLYFDGSDVGFNNADEDIRGVWVSPDESEIYFTTRGNFSSQGVSGNDRDIFRFTPTSLGSSTAGSFTLHWDGSANGLSERISGTHVSP